MLYMLYFHLLLFFFHLPYRLILRYCSALKICGFHFPLALLPMHGVLSPIPKTEIEKRINLRVWSKESFTKFGKSRVVDYTNWQGTRVITKVKRKVNYC